MNASLRMRTMKETDLPFADWLRALTGWNQTMEDWRRFLAMQPEGCFLAEWNGMRAGTATTVVYGVDLAWIGMVLVHPEYRRRGVGRALLLKCIEYLQGLKVKCIKLDATPEGRPVYEKLGFKEEWGLRRWEGEFSGVADKISDGNVRAWQDVDAARFDPCDAHAFGASRRSLIMALARQSHRALSCEKAPRIPAGYGFLRSGARASYLGPIVATSRHDGIALIESLLAQAGAGRVFWDIPDANAPAVDWAGRHGFNAQRSLTRMWLGENCRVGNPLEQFAIAGPELG